MHMCVSKLLINHVRIQLEFMPYEGHSRSRCVYWKRNYTAENGLSAKGVCVSVCVCNNDVCAGKWVHLTREKKHNAEK